MKLHRWREGLQLYIDNAIYLRNDGELLMKYGSYGHAYFLFYTALEEIGAGFFVLSNYNEAKPKELKKILFSRGSHQKKSFLMIFDQFSSEIPNLNLPKDYLKELFKSQETEIQFFARKLDEKFGFWKKRNRSLYIDLIEKNTDWHTPKEITMDELTQLHEAVNNAIKDMINAVFIMVRLHRMQKRLNLKETLITAT